MNHGSRARARWILPRVVLGVWLAWPVSHAGAQAAWDDDSLGEMLDAGAALVEALVPSEMRREVTVPDKEDWNAFWGSVQSALTSDDPDDLAALGPSARDALTWLDRVPELEPMADWLRQRLDYLDAAAEGDSALPAPAAPPGSTKPLQWPHPAPSPASDHRETTPHKTLAKSVSRVDYWKRRMQGRVVPPRRTEIIPTLKRIFREEGVPAELVWMAEAESTLNPAARSPAGAAGLFQFMPATAGRFGLKLRPHDERLEPEKNARAAAQYLRELNGQFGDWPLTLAAFNAGEGRVDRALKGSAGKSFEAIAWQLPAETRMYVPKVLATIALREGHDFPAVAATSGFSRAWAVLARAL